MKRHPSCLAWLMIIALAFPWMSAGIAGAQGMDHEQMYEGRNALPSTIHHPNGV